MMGDYPQPGNNEFTAEQEKAMRQGSRFSPQGNTGGPVNMAGKTNMGKDAVMRSESTEHEQASRRDPGPSSVLQSLISPQGAALRDAISDTARKTKAATGDYP